MAKRIQDQTEEERVVSKSSPIVSKSPGMSGASEKPGSRMNLEASSFEAASTSQVQLKDAYLIEEQGNLVNEKEQISEETDDSESAPLKITNFVGNHLQENSRIHLFTVSETSKQQRSDIGTLLCHIATNNLLHGSRPRHGQEDLRKTIRRSYGGFGRECGHMGNIHECHSQSSSSFRK